MPACAIIDIGKTHCRLSVFEEGVVRWSARQPTPPVVSGTYPSLDTDGIRRWLLAALGEAAARFEIFAILPVAHGATAALTDDAGELVAPVMDYETDIPERISAPYSVVRPPFSETGSPDLPAGLNLGRQLAWLEDLGALERARFILPWPQYWAAQLCGVPASDVCSLGCHTDLWAPRVGAPSSLALARGWAGKLGPIYPPGAILGEIRPDIAAFTGLPRACRVHCGIHDSNAVLHALSAIHGSGPGRPILVATGTWSIVFAPGRDLSTLPAERDTLINVGVDGTPVPTARIMGGREYAAVAGGTDRQAGWDAIRDAIARRAMALPSFCEAGGPFPGQQGRLVGGDDCEKARVAIASLYLALLWNEMVELVAPGEPEAPIIIEGPAATPIHAGLMAALRPAARIFAASDALSPALGGALLAGQTPRTPPLISRHTQPEGLRDLRGYQAEWQAAVARQSPQPPGAE